MVLAAGGSVAASWALPALSPPGAAFPLCLSLAIGPPARSVAQRAVSLRWSRASGRGPPGRPAADADLDHRARRRGDDGVLHLHRLEGRDRIARRDDLVAARHVDREDGTRHRRDDVRGAAAAGVGRRGPGGPVDVRRRGDPERHGPAVDVDVHDVSPTRTKASDAPSVGAVVRDGPRIGRSRRARRRRRGGPRAGPFSRQPPASRARAASCPGGVRDPLATGSWSDAGGQIASSVSIRAWPRRTAGWRTSQRRNAEVRRQAEDHGLVERRGQSGEGLGAVGAVGDDLRQHRVEPARHLVAGGDPGIDADARRRPASAAPSTRPGRRQEPGLRVLGVEADLDRVAARAGRRACPNPSGSPAAIRIWSATRSRPVTSSVTGCSTWSRVFISRKKTSPRSSRRNSQVPALS